MRISLTSEGGDRLTPDTTPQECNDGDDIIVDASMNAIYECENKQQLIKYFHAALGSHPKATLIGAAKANYLRGCPGLNPEAISKFIGVETATEMGHMKQVQKGVRSTTTQSNRGRQAREKKSKKP